jgi:hypothetical protein
MVSLSRLVAAMETIRMARMGIHFIVHITGHFAVVHTHRGMYMHTEFTHPIELLLLV